MQIHIEELIELVKSVKPMFLNHAEAEHVTVKGRADFVTQVDIRVQEYMKKELSKRWPSVQFMGEEKDNSDIDFDGAVWILDPVDGTTNLIHDFKDDQIAFGVRSDCVRCTMTRPELSGCKTSACTSPKEMQIYE